VGGRALTGSWALVLYGLWAALVIFILFPLVVPISISFTTARFVSFPPEGLSVQWYAKIFGDREFISAALYSLRLSGFATLVSLSLSVPAAIALVRYRPPAADLILAVVIAPMVVPVIITGIALLRFFSLYAMTTTWTNLVVAHVVITLPFVVRTVVSSLTLVNRSSEEAALTLGANPLVVFWRVTLPQIIPGIIAGGLFAFVFSFDDYVASMWLSDASNVTLPIYVFNLLAKSFDPSVPAIATVMMSFSLTMFFVINRLIGLKRVIGF
jgi:putative spermidine/putrescine transport system permease protein